MLIFCKVASLRPQAGKVCIRRPTDPRTNVNRAGKFQRINRASITAEIYNRAIEASRSVKDFCRYFQFDPSTLMLLFSPINLITQVFSRFYTLEII